MPARPGILADSLGGHPKWADMRWPGRSSVMRPRRALYRSCRSPWHVRRRRPPLARGTEAKPLRLNETGGMKLVLQLARESHSLPFPEVAEPEEGLRRRRDFAEKTRDELALGRVFGNGAAQPPREDLEWLSWTKRPVYSGSAKIALIGKSRGNSLLSPKSLGWTIKSPSMPRDAIVIGILPP